MAEDKHNEEDRDRKSEGKPDSPRKKRLRLWIIGGLAVLFLAAGVIYGIYWFTTARFYVGTDDAYVDGNTISISPQVIGIVAAVYADNTDLVERGQVLVQLDQNDAKVALAQAEAQLGQAVRQVRQIYEQEAEAEAAVAQA
ncbi:MAG: biotin/lipoyl-binding protein, partial [Verrucomicrobia bacterium]|nr:biotin/lipoyl-binding protein [Verrucomicrobiota bacterium]